MSLHILIYSCKSYLINIRLVDLMGRKVKGWAIWITGLPGSGKSIVAHKLWKVLSKMGVDSQIISSDALRRFLTPKPTYSEEEREIVYRAIAYIAKTLTDNGVNVIIDATGNRRRYRAMCRRMIDKFFEVYLRCPLEVCIRREMARKERFYAPRDIYGKAMRGMSTTVPGFGVPYEPPRRPEVLIESDRQKPNEIVETVIGKLSNVLCKP
ncbi:MAG: adenylyl-sulfate kinase [Candidatus Bathyarchaeia archaeon]